MKWKKQLCQANFEAFHQDISSSIKSLISEECSLSSIAFFCATHQGILQCIVYIYGHQLVVQLLDSRLNSCIVGTTPVSGLYSIADASLVRLYNAKVRHSQTYIVVVVELQYRSVSKSPLVNRWCCCSSVGRRAADATIIQKVCLGKKDAHERLLAIENLIIIV